MDLDEVEEPVPPRSPSMVLTPTRRRKKHGQRDQHGDHLGSTTRTIAETLSNCFRSPQWRIRASPLHFQVASGNVVMYQLTVPPWTFLCRLTGRRLPRRRGPSGQYEHCPDPSNAKATSTGIAANLSEDKRLLATVAVVISSATFMTSEMTVRLGQDSISERLRRASKEHPSGLVRQHTQS